MTALLLGWSNKYPDSLDKAAELAVSSLQNKWKGKQSSRVRRFDLQRGSVSGTNNCLRTVSLVASGWGLP
ncbi:hypothetical protein GQ457_04G024860 [Hibiscus cannabinus]